MVLGYPKSLTYMKIPLLCSSHLSFSNMVLIFQTIQTCSWAQSTQKRQLNFSKSWSATIVLIFLPWIQGKNKTTNSHNNKTSLNRPMFVNITSSFFIPRAGKFFLFRKASLLQSFIPLNSSLLYFTLLKMLNSLLTNASLPLFQKLTSEQTKLNFSRRT